jgi:hypothetical protein
LRFSRASVARLDAYLDREQPSGGLCAEFEVEVAPVEQLRCRKKHGHVIRVNSSRPGCRTNTPACRASRSGWAQPRRLWGERCRTSFEVEAHGKERSRKRIDHLTQRTELPSPPASPASPPPELALLLPLVFFFGAMSPLDTTLKAASATDTEIYMQLPWRVSHPVVLGPRRNRCSFDSVHHKCDRCGVYSVDHTSACTRAPVLLVRTKM